MTTVWMISVLAAGLLPGADVVRVGDGSAPPGRMAEAVAVSATNDQAIQGFSFSIWFPPDRLEVADVIPSAAVQALRPEYFEYTVEDALGNLAVAAIFEMAAPYDLVTLAPSPSLFRDLALVTFNVLEDAAPGVLPLELRDGPGEFPIKSVFVVDGESVLPATVHGTFEVLPPAPIAFRRGYINGDMALDISDVIYFLSWLFRGGPQPSCLAAANVNGQGKVDLSDAIWLLDFVFRGGPPPPSPFSACGEAPADSYPLTCLKQTVCP